MAEPVFVGLLFADRVITEKSNKKGIIGTFTRFYSETFPTVFPPWFIYAAVTNLEGEHSFSLNLVHDKTKQVIIPIGGKFGVDKPKSVVELAIQVANTMFPEEGDYTLTFNIDGRYLAARVLEVMRPKQEGA